jgi:PKD repeat protein
LFVGNAAQVDNINIKLKGPYYASKYILRKGPIMPRKLYRRILLTAFALLFVVGTTAASFAQGQSDGKRVLIGFEGGRGRQIAQQRRAIVSSLGGAVHDSFHIIPVVSAILSEQAMKGLKNNPQVTYIEDDVVLHAIVESIPWGVNKIGTPTAWATSRGAGVDVAILDTGIDYDHPDLVNNIAGGIYFAGGWLDELFGYDGSTNPIYWDDGFGHGTHCAGIVGAEDNEVGAIGVAPLARLHAVKVLDDTGSGYTSDIIQGIQWCIDNSIDVGSMSFGGGGTASLQSACDAAYNAGVLLVAAVGNDYGGPVIHPAAYDSVIAVSATDSGDNIAPFSNSGSQVELAAPGVSIYSTVPPTGDPRIADPSGYNYLSGTSMACPHVSGTAALVIAAGIGDVRNQLRATAVDLNPAGKDIYSGYGRVNAVAAVQGSGGPIPVVANFTANPTSGNPPLDVQFTDQSTGDVTSWSWDFGDGGSSDAQNPSHTYTATGTYTVALTVSGSDGEDTETKIDYITVTEPAPAPLVADFEGSPTSGDAPLTVNFTDLSSGDPISWGWDFGDGGSSFVRNPSYTYSEAGTYDVTLIVMNSLLEMDMVTKVDYITVTGPAGNPPIADFSASPTSGEAPLSVQFTDLSTNNPTSWSWDFGDGVGTSTLQNPTYTYNAAGTYTVTLTATNAYGSGFETKTNYINVTELPVADFEGSPTSGDAPLTVNFTDLSTGSPASWSWDFGDGETSTQQNPSHTYNATGFYTVTLTATNAYGSDVVTKTDYINVTEPSTGVTVTGINPETASNGSYSFDATITGSGFADGASVTFENGSGPAPKASNIIVTENGTIIAVAIKLKSGGPPRNRQWDVRVTNPDGSTGVLVGGFTVIP